MPLVTINGELYHYGVKGMKWGVRRAKKWATSKHQPSSTKSSVLAGMYAATGNKRVGKALDKSNDRDAEKWAQAKEIYKNYQKKEKAKKAAGEKRYSNRQIKRDMNETYNTTYKDLHEKYKKTTPATAADRAHVQAKKINTKHLIDTYGKERMDQYYKAEQKKLIGAGALLVGSMASMSVVALVANKKL